ncbi:TPA: hypothetical protein U1D20_001916 [Streptococcus suis]|nr:hypothetical protein [Streptococcus suis]
MLNYFELVNKDYLDNHFKLESRVDPDSKCRELYIDLTKMLFDMSNRFPNGDLVKKTEVKERIKNREKYWELVLTVESKHGEKKIFGLGIDYIGASVYWALKKDVSQVDIKELLKVSRTIGGHIFFPRWQISNIKVNIKSINMARGGEFICKNKNRLGFYDRFDMLLFDMKRWYEGNSCQLKEEFDSNKIWLDLFIDFRGFIDYFSLNGFVNDKYEVINLTHIEKVIDGFESYIPDNTFQYIEYFKNSNNIISVRFKE